MLAYIIAFILLGTLNLPIVLAEPDLKRKA